MTQAKLDNKPRTTSMDDYRCWAQIASEFLLELREHLQTLPKTVSTDQMISRIDYFLLNDKLPPRSN